MANELSKEIDDILKIPIVDRHSFFQLKYFVIGKEPTVQAKLWRCIRELDARKKSLEDIGLEIESLNDKLELLHIKMEKGRLTPFGNDVSAKEQEIQLRQLAREKTAILKTIENLNNKKKYIQEEADFFVKAYKSLEQHEKVKPYDDLPSQVAYWNEKLSQELNLKLLLRQPLEPDLIKTIIAMENDVPVKKYFVNLLEEIKKRALLEKKNGQ